MRTRILEAAIELIGEIGPFGLTLALVAERAGVSRALPTYQFNTRHELLVAAATSVLESNVASQELGLAPLLSWMRDELDGAAAGGLRLHARLAFLIGPSDPVTREIVAAHWSSLLGLIQSHLEHSRKRQEVRSDLDLGAVAAALLGQLLGEMARLLTQGQSRADANVFLTLVRASIATDAPKRQPPKRPFPAPSKDQPGLF